MRVTRSAATVVAVCLAATVSATVSASEPPGETSETNAGELRPVSFHDLGGHEGTSWNLELHLGVRALSEPALDQPFFGRLGGGVLIATGSFYWTIDATVGLGDFSRLAFGAEAQLTHQRTGLWAGLGGARSVVRGPLASASAGWHVFGLELQALPGADLGFEDLVEGRMAYALMIKLRVPVGILHFGITYPVRRPTSLPPADPYRALAPAPSPAYVRH